MSPTLPPDLRVLCRKLTSTPPESLPHALPSLINHVLRCKLPLSTTQEQKIKGDSSETAVLVSKLKTSVKTLLTSRTKEARFAATALIKAMIDVGGWEVLRGSGAWVAGLLSIIQKSDPLPSKELAIVTLTRIYMLVQPYQTLVREIATPTIPDFGKTCLQILKASVEGHVAFSIVETICDAFSTLIPLYPPTFRPFSASTYNALKSYLAPTDSDGSLIPDSLRRAARRLVILQHYVAAKSGGSDEWAKLVDGVLTQFHATADQVFRAVDESWDPPTGISRTTVDLGVLPQGGGEHLPTWVGIEAGSQRLIGLLQYLSDCLSYSTKSAMVIPLAKIVDTISRVCLIARLSPKTQTWDKALQTKAAIDREEKDELWSSISDIHIAALRLLRTMFQRLGKDMIPLTPESLDHTIRVFKSDISSPTMRATSYATFNDALSIAGPTLSKHTIDMLDSVIGACCRDLQEDAGHLKPNKTTPTPTDTKKNSVAANADLFLQQPQSASAETSSATLTPAHKSAATTFLATIFSSLPQQHLKPSLRSLLDQTAILTGNRDAMLASVLNPYRDQRGRVYPSILPHLSQQFPEDKGLEILRTNLRPDVARPDDEIASVADAADLDDIDEEMGEDDMLQSELLAETVEEPAQLVDTSVPESMEISIPSQNNTLTPKQSRTAVSGFGTFQPRATSPPKRKHEGSDPTPPKRQELEAPSQTVKEAIEVEDDSDSEGSVHLNMELEDDEDDEEEDGADVIKV